MLPPATRSRPSSRRRPRPLSSRASSPTPRTRSSRPTSPETLPRRPSTPRPVSRSTETSSSSSPGTTTSGVTLPECATSSPTSPRLTLPPSNLTTSPRPSIHARSICNQLSRRRERMKAKRECSLGRELTARRQSHACPSGTRATLLFILLTYSERPSFQRSCPLSDLHGLVRRYRTFGRCLTVGTRSCVRVNRQHARAFRAHTSLAQVQHPLHPFRPCSRIVTSIDGYTTIISLSARPETSSGTSQIEEPAPNRTSDPGPELNATSTSPTPRLSVLSSSPTSRQTSFHPQHGPLWYVDDSLLEPPNAVTFKGRP